MLVFIKSKIFVSDQIVNANVNKLKFTQNLSSHITSRILFFKDGLIWYLCKFKRNTQNKTVILHARGFQILYVCTRQFKRIFLFYNDKKLRHW